MNLLGLKDRIVTSVEELKNKIPQELKDFIVDNADISYPYRIDELLPESKALFASILEKYINI